MTATIEQIYDVCDATWPAARKWDDEHWTLRDGQGGGKRVSAATLCGTFDDAAIPAAETAMRELGQAPLFMIRQGEAELDAALDARGYAIVDPVVAYVAPISQLTDIPIPRVTAFVIWEPLAIMKEVWAKGGIGPARLNVMARAAEKTAIFARWNEKPAGTAFAAIHDGICMVHAVEVLEDQRQQGVGAWIMRAAAFWAQKQGATEIAVLCTTANLGANKLYSGLGFVPVGHYHYRQLQSQGSN